MTATDQAQLSDLREQISEIDEMLLTLIAERFEKCEKVAEYKRANAIPMMQPERLDALRDKVGRFAEHNGVDGEFLRDLFELITQESCRLEDSVIGNADGGRSRLSGSAVRIDHVAVAVRDLQAAIGHLERHYGFEVIERRKVTGEISGMDSATMRAGNVTVVLCQGDSPRSNVSKYIEHYGPGVQHIAIQVRGLESLLGDLKERDADLLTGVIHAPGLNQSFTKREPNCGIQFEFISRAENTGFSDNNVRELFTAMERENVY